MTRPSWTYAIATPVAVVLAVLAARADSRNPAMTTWRIALDVAVGVVFIIAAAVAPGQPRTRAVFAAVGGSWLLGSIEDDAALVHQSLLVVVLVGFPTLPRGRIAWLLVALAVPIALLLVSQIGVAALFAAVAANAALVSVRRDPVAGWYPAAAAGGIAVVLAASWSAARWNVDAFDPSTRLTTYELLLLAVSLAYPAAMRTIIAGRARLADDVLADTGLAGLSGLAAVLRDVLRDPDLRLCRWQGREQGYVDVDDGSQADPVAGRWLFVDDASGPLSAVAHRSAALEDPPTAAAVSSAVRLAVVHEQLQEELAARLDDLSAARTRLMAAADRQRVATASRLRGDVVAPLEHAVAELGSITVTPPDGEAAEAVGVAVRELTAGAADVLAVVDGVPPAVLGGNRLCAAVEALAQRSPIDVRVQASPVAAADSDTETTLFYVCSEALTNAVKHAGASRIHVVIKGDERSVEVVITDDGCGGADAAGSGLQGLADRVAARHGRLRVVSPPGAGTSVTATIPRQN